jgi:hypothetical protein
MKLSVDGDISVEELVAQYPEAAGFLADRGVVCIVCGEPYWGTLRDLMAAKGMGDKVAQTVVDLEAYIRNQRASSAS